MEKYTLKSVFFKKLKGLNNVNITFSDSLTAIMGVNGAGKTTVIHALACMFQPDPPGKGEEHKFPDFFVPTTDSPWMGSEFHAVLENDNGHGGRAILPSREFSKKSDRWAPRYTSRPKRNVYYIGIDSCLPEIEKASQTTMIRYASTAKTDNTSKKILENAGYILNKDYDQFLDNNYHDKHFIGVMLRTGMKYSSLSMGTGEQRTLKILEKVFKAEQYSLILIDEIDLLLHVSAIHRLIELLSKVALEKHLQIVFTTHSLEMLSLQNIVSIRYIDAIKNQDGSFTNFVYDAPNDEIVRGLTGTSNHPLRIFVEDSFSQAIVKSVLKKHSVCRKANVARFGSASNAFTLAAGQVLSGVDLTNTAIILDGDVYKTPDLKRDQMDKALTGTETDTETKRATALSCILQYELPDGKQPEEFVFDLLMSIDNDSEILQIAREINAVRDRHQLIGQICEQLHESVDIVMSDIINMICDKPEWQSYIAPIDEWVNTHKDS